MKSGITYVYGSEKKSKFLNLTHISITVLYYYIIIVNLNAVYITKDLGRGCYRQNSFKYNFELNELRRKTRQLHS